MLEQKNHGSEKGQDSEEEFHSKLEIFTTRKFQVSFILFYFIISIIIVALVQYYNGPTIPQTFEGCFKGHILIYVVLNALLSIVFGYLVLQYIKFKDPFLIKTHLLIDLIIAALGLPSFFILQTVDTYYQPFHNPIFQPLLLVWVVGCIFTMMITAFPIYAAKRDENTLQRSNSAHHMVNLEVILDTPELLDSFKDFVAQHWCSETILFLVEVRKFLNSRGDSTIATAIVQQFILYGSPNELNLMAMDRSRIVETFNSGSYDINLFNLAVR
jgi:hypothetical protein